MPFIGIPDHEQRLIEQICAAIARKNLIHFWYEDSTKDRKDWRTVEPYIVGSSRKGKIQMLGWFRSEEKEGWRLYNLSHISRFSQLANDYFIVRDSFDPTDRKMNTIYGSV